MAAGHGQGRKKRKAMGVPFGEGNIVAVRILLPGFSRMAVGPRKMCCIPATTLPVVVLIICMRAAMSRIMETWYSVGVFALAIVAKNIERPSSHCRCGRKYA